MSATLAALSLITLSVFVILIPIVYIVTVAIRQGLELSNDTHGGGEEGQYIESYRD